MRPDLRALLAKSVSCSSRVPLQGVKHQDKMVRGVRKICVLERSLWQPQCGGWIGHGGFGGPAPRDTGSAEGAGRSRNLYIEQVAQVTLVHLKVTFEKHQDKTQPLLKVHMRLL